MVAGRKRNCAVRMMHRPAAALPSSTDWTGVGRSSSPAREPLASSSPYSILKDKT
jgi:hypothetical protein